MALSKKDKKIIAAGAGILGAGGVLAYFLTREKEEERECSSDADCLPGYICIGGKCFAQGPSCSVDSDCPTGYVCVNGSCVQLTDPCIGVNCPNTCLGSDKWSQKCVNHLGNPVCVADQVIEADSPDCGGIPPQPDCSSTNPCPDKCVGDDLYSQNCVNEKCVQGSLVEECSSQCGCSPPPVAKATVTSLAASPNTSYLDSFNINATIRNDGAAWQFFVLLEVTDANGTIHSMNLVSTGTLSTNQAWNYPSVMFTPPVAGNNTIKIVVYSDSAGTNVVAQKTISYNFSPTPPVISAVIGYPDVSPYSAYRGDLVAFTAMVTNNGNVPYDFAVGCSIIAEDGHQTDADEFCCGTWTGDPNWYCTIPCNAPYKNVYLQPGETKSVTFYERIGPLAGIQSYQVLMAVYEARYMDWSDRLDDNVSTWYVVG